MLYYLDATICLNNFYFALTTFFFFLLVSIRQLYLFTVIFLKDDLHFLPKGAAFSSCLLPFLLGLHTAIEDCSRVGFTQRYICSHTQTHTHTERKCKFHCKRESYITLILWEQKGTFYIFGAPIGSCQAHRSIGKFLRIQNSNYCYGA